MNIKYEITMQNVNIEGIVLWDYGKTWSNISNIARAPEVGLSLEVDQKFGIDNFD